MKAPALVTVDQVPEAFVALFEAARQRGMRVGWLDLSVDEAVPTAPALKVGATKAVAVGDDRVVSVKRISGRTVLRDLVREHFLGYAVVLVHGHQGSPSLRSTGMELRLEEGGRVVSLPADALLSRLLRPRYRV